jgi:phospholipase C
LATSCPRGLQVRSAAGTQPPRTYTVEPGKQLRDTWEPVSGYDLTVHGPNGFLRGFKTTDPATGLGVAARYDERADQILLTFTNHGAARTVSVRDGYSSRVTTLTLGPGDAQARHWSLSRTRGWYDLVVTVEGEPGFAYRYAGHLENGEDSISDPAMGGLVHN